MKRLLQRSIFRRSLLAVFGFAAALSPVLAQDYTYTTNSGAITVTGYTGSGGAVNIPSTLGGLPVTSIGNHAFEFNTSLTSVTIPIGVTNIGDDAFWACTGLTNVTIPNGVTNIGKGAFYLCALTSVTIPTNVITILDFAFNLCTNLTSVTIPGSVTSIGTGAFSQCYSLTNVTIGFGVTGIGISAFMGCPLISVTIPDSVTSIGSHAFWGCNKLASVTIPASVTNVGGYPFLACSSLSAITVVTNNPIYSSLDGVLFDKNQTTLLEYPAGAASQYTVPNSVTSITSNAFYGCNNLGSITIPSSVTNIGAEAFRECTNLTIVCFLGNAPIGGLTVFFGDYNVTVYYLPGTLGWFSTFGGRPTTLWNGQPLATVAVTGNPSGAIEGASSGNYEVGSSLQIGASGITGWTFSSWSDSNTQNPRTITVPPTNITYIANFSQTPAATITVQANPSNGGSAIGGGIYYVGSSQQISATANSGWTFSGWSDGNTQNPRTITVPLGGATYTAYFSPTSCTYALSTTSTNVAASGGSGSVSVTTGSECSWTVTTNQTWLRTTNSGTGSGTVSYTVDANIGLARVGVFSVQGRAFTVYQAGNIVAMIESFPVVAPLVPVMFTPDMFGGSSNSVSCLWNFGDGQTSTDCEPSHVFSNCGPHDVTAIVSDGIAPVTNSLLVSVTCPFSELAKPVSLKMKSNFAPGKLDTANFKTFVDLPSGFSVASTPVSLEVAGASVPFTLNAKGQGVNGSSSIKVTHKGSATSTVWQVTGKLKGDYDSGWQNYGLTNATVTATNITVPVLLLFDAASPESFLIDKPSLYKATAGKSGTAK
jgi:hypothetical protein